MRHLGDITKISGLTAPIVDCIIGGSPCQDLSVAGKRASEIEDFPIAVTKKRFGGNIDG